jgi:hypothetical protein
MAALDRIPDDHQFARVLWFGAVLLLALIAIVVRLAQVQIVEG